MQCDWDCIWCTREQGWHLFHLTDIIHSVVIWTSLTGNREKIALTGLQQIRLQVAGWILQPLLVPSRILVARWFPISWQMLGVNYYLLDFQTFICYVLEVFQDLTIRKTFNRQKAYAHATFLICNKQVATEIVLLAVTLKQIFILSIRKSMSRFLKFAKIN